MPIHPRFMCSHSILARKQWAGPKMRRYKTLFVGNAALMLFAASASSADARWFDHRGPGPVAGLIGGVIVGAATIATLPFALLADAARPLPPPPRYYRGYGPPPGYGYGY